VAKEMPHHQELFRFRIGFLMLFILIFFILTVTLDNKLNAASVDFSSSKNSEQKAYQLLPTLTLEQKVGQLFIVGGSWRNPRSLSFIKHYHFGNAYLGNEDVGEMNPQQVTSLTQPLQTEALSQNRIPMLIFIDQEGGMVNRLKNGFTIFPSPEEMAKQTPEKMEKAARITAQQLRTAGIHVNFAPVVDVGSNPASHIVKYHRSFSSVPQNVAQCARIYVKTFQEENVLACVKHFPNDGDLDQDPHQEFPINHKTKEELLATSMVPYRELIRDGLLQMVMISHVSVPALEPDRSVPVSLSKNAIEDFLRKEMGFNGLVVTDVMNMKALGNGEFPNKKQIGINTIKAVEAGANMLLFVGSEQSNIVAYEELLKAFKGNKLSQKWLNETVLKIIKLKLEYVSEW
jgi:beta-N-acetylhexosaminidase